MALDIGVGSGSSFCPVRGEPSLSFESDGYYWFLHPLFEGLRTDTGQFIDLFGDASFAGNEIFALERMLKAAKELVLAQPRSWDVCIGFELDPRQKETQRDARLKEIFGTVERDHFLDVLSQLNRVVARAKELSRPVICFGD
jgi:hypothetical protein